MAITVVKVAESKSHHQGEGHLSRFGHGGNSRFSERLFSYGMGIGRCGKTPTHVKLTIVVGEVAGESLIDI